MFRKPCLIFASWILATTSSLAATITVINTNDSGVGSLRAALSSAASGDTIDFNLALPATITLSTQLGLGGSKVLEVRGPGANQLTISGNNTVRVFAVSSMNSGLGSTISGLTIANGRVSSPNDGGGIYLSGGALTLVNCVVTNCSARFGGGVAADADTRLNVLDSVISDNNATSGGGGIATVSNALPTEIIVARSTISGNSAGAGGGGVSVGTSHTLTMTNSRITGSSTNGSGGGILNNAGSVAMQGGSIDANQANGDGSNGGGIFTSGNCTLTDVTVSGNTMQGVTTAGGGIHNGGTLAVARCTISGNTVTGGTNLVGGGINNGGGFNNVAGTLTATNSTISGNIVTGSNSVGGGIYNASNSTAALTSCTTANNSSFAAAGIFNGSNAIVTLRNNIIAQNLITVQNNSGPDVSGAFVSSGYNLIGDGRGGTGFTNPRIGDKIGGGGGPAVINPLLDPLADNGGPTKTHALQLGSPATDCGSPGFGVVTDQRGFPRFTKGDVATMPGSTNADIGAFEYGNTALRITSITRPSDGSIIVQGIGLPNALHSVQVSPNLTSGFTTLGPIFSDGSGNLQFEDSDADTLPQRFYRFRFPAE